MNVKNVYTKIMSWISYVFTTDPNSLVLVEWENIEGNLSQEVMPAGKADDIMESLFNKRTFGTKRGCVVNDVAVSKENLKNSKVHNYIKINMNLVDKKKNT